MRSHGLETPDAAILFQDSSAIFRKVDHTTDRTDVLSFIVL
jgi:hypothetical protein